MNHTKKTGKVLTLTVLTAVVLFYMLPNVAFIEQTLEIRATPANVFELINRPENWVEWYTPVHDRSNVAVRFIGTSEGKGAGMRWATNSPKTSEGIMNIRNSKNNRKVTSVVTIDNRRSAVMNFYIRPVGFESSMLTITTRLQFRQDSIFHYLRLMFDRSDELDIIDYLEKIDNVAFEKIGGGIDVHLQRIDTFSYISILDSCALNDLLKCKELLYNELLVFGARSGIDITVHPIVVYHRIDERQMVFEFGIPVAEQMSTSGRIRYKTILGGDNVVANYYGEYDTLEDGHNAIQHWLIRHDRKQTGHVWEMYVTDPSTEPDPNKWLTRIYYPVN